MLPQPRRTKYRKEQKGRNRGLATTGNSVAFGEFGLKSIELGNLSYRQLEAARRAMSRHVKKVGKIWIRVAPVKPITRKPAEVRMGNGKGSVEFYVAQVRPGTVIFEISGVNEDFAREIFKKAGAKLPVKTVMVAREIGA
jgi:large subunit ribosomal protein L16